MGQVMGRVVGFGEALLRLQPETGVRLEEAQRLMAFVGGAEVNVCCALAELGVPAALFSVVPEGPLGRRVRRHLAAAGVDVDLLHSAPGRLGSYWVDYGREPRGIDVVYDRRDSTITQVRPQDVPWEALRKARAFVVSGITPALSEAARSVTLAMAEAARRDGVLVVTDLNYRARLWSAGEAAPVLERLARLADVVIATEADLRALYGFDGGVEAVAHQAALLFEAKTLALTRGGEGGLLLRGGTLVRAAAYPLHHVDRIGAGDAFTAGFLYATLTARAERALEYGLALAALKHSVAGDSLTTTADEVERVVRRDSGEIRR